MTIAVYAVALFAWSALRHAHFGSHAFDLGAYHGTFYNLGFHGSLWSPVERSHSWSSHLEVGLLPLGLLYRIAPTPLWLFALQSAACAATALPVEALARRVTGDARLAFVCGTAMLLTPQLLFASNADFHSITLCAFPMALLAVGIELDALALVIVGAALALSLREQMGLAVAGAAAAWVIRHGKRRVAAAALLLCVGLSAFFAEVLWLIPSFATDGTFRHLAGNYSFGTSSRDVIQFALAHPVRFLTLPFEGRRRLVYPLALASGAGLPMLLAARRPCASVIAPLCMLTPLLLLQLYSARVVVFSIESQYGAPLVPLIGVAAVMGISTLRERSPSFAWAVAITWLVVTTVHASLSVGPHAFDAGGPLDRSFVGSPRAVALARAVAMIPKDSVSSAQDAINPHLDGEAYLWPHGEDIARFVVLDANVEPNVETHETVIEAEERLRNDPRFEVRLDEAGILLVERR